MAMRAPDEVAGGVVELEDVGQLRAQSRVGTGIGAAGGRGREQTRRGHHGGDAA
jgi:hypothetical protein